jgi:hypothetical protein
MKFSQSVIVVVGEEEKWVTNRGESRRNKTEGGEMK